MRMRKAILVLSILSLGAVLLTGCGKEEVNTVGEQIVFSVGHEKIQFDETYVYAKTIIEGYEQSYGPAIWSMVIEDDGNADSVENITRQDIIDTIIKVKVLVDKADEYDVSLTAQEEDSVKTQAETFYSKLTDEDIANSGITKELAEKVFEENMIASKVYDAALKDNDSEVSDEDARMSIFYDLIFETYTVVDEKVEPYTEEEKKARYDEAQKAFETLSTGEDTNIEDLAILYDLSYASKHVMSKEDIEREYGTSNAETILALSDGTYSNIIESEYGYHIIKMITLTDKDETAAHKAQMMNTLDKEYFDELYTKWRKSYCGSFNYKSDVDQDVFSQIKFGENIE